MLGKTFIKLNFFMNLKITDETGILIEEFKEDYDNLDHKINVELKLLSERLKIEQNNDDLEAFYKQISTKIKTKDWKSALDYLKRILESLRPLDVYELKLLIKKAREAADEIRNQDIILLMGNTGSGKSTTIHFLAGSTMTKRSIFVGGGEYINHIAPEEPYRNKKLCSVICSSKAESETRYLNPIPVNFKEIGGFDDKTFIICDSPGFGDTKGIEIDIANGIGIIEGVKESKSVKPVFLFSYLNLQDRGEGICNLAHFLVNMVNNIED